MVGLETQVNGVIEMSITEKLLSDDWQHDAGADRIEYVCAHNPELAKGIAKLALRFISEKGHSDEFADVLEEIERIQEAAESASPEP